MASPGQEREDTSPCILPLPSSTSPSCFRWRKWRLCKISPRTVAITHLMTQQSTHRRRAVSLGVRIRAPQSPAVHQLRCWLAAHTLLDLRCCERHVHHWTNGAGIDRSWEPQLQRPAVPNLAVCRGLLRRRCVPEYRGRKAPGSFGGRGRRHVRPGIRSQHHSPLGHGAA